LDDLLSIDDVVMPEPLDTQQQGRSTYPSLDEDEDVSGSDISGNLSDEGELLSEVESVALMDIYRYSDIATTFEQ
jgi:hypothetical protein